MRQWFIWHFGKTPLAIFQAWCNIIRYHFYHFPVSDLLKNLFSPWKKYQWSKGRGFSLGRWTEVCLSNFFSRLLGSILRLTVVIWAIVSFFFLLFIAVLSFVVWLVLPFLAIFLIVVGLVLLI